MRNAQTILTLIRDRGIRRLPLERVYRLLYVPDLYLLAYGKIAKNAGATTAGVSDETADGMRMAKIESIITALRSERYRWTPARRTYIPKKNGTRRPLGIPSWSDKLLQDVLRLILEAYYDVQFSRHAHGFRPKRGCHTALRDIYHNWVGTTWFIEGDIADCFGQLPHQHILDRLRQDIHDERFIRLIGGLLSAGYMERWRHHQTYSGTPQGSGVSPILANICLDTLDRWVEHTLIPQYTRGERRGRNIAYEKLMHHANYLTRTGRKDAGRTVRRQAQQLPSQDPNDPAYRRLRYCRYADDMLLGFIGTKAEAETIKRELGTFLHTTLHLTLSDTKTLVTHARSQKARFLGYDIHTLQSDTHFDQTRRRSINGNIGLRVPPDVIQTHCRRYIRQHGKPQARTELINDTDFTIIALFQSEFRGLVQYYRLAYNLHSLTKVEGVMETALTKTLAAKLRLSVPKVYAKYNASDTVNGRRYSTLAVTIERPNKKPLVAQWGGIPLRWDVTATVDDSRRTARWPTRTELVKRLLADTCELCGATGPDARIEVHHSRALKDLKRHSGREQPLWVKMTATRQRKTLVVCAVCHQDITHGRPLRRVSTSESR